MKDKVRFAFTEVDPNLGALSTLPYLPIILTYRGQSLRRSGLLDTGSSVNVLPYEMGLSLGAVWENQTLSIPLGGNLAKFEARALVLTANVVRGACQWQSIRSYRFSFCLDTRSKCSTDFRAHEFSIRIRCVFLSQ
jgi:hypothetical protein